jgi:hypothetical protein
MTQTVWLEKGIHHFHVDYRANGDPPAQTFVDWNIAYLKVDYYETA